MSGSLNVLLAAFAGSGPPVGYLASITNPSGSTTSLDYLQLALRSDQMAIAARTYSGVGVQQLTTFGLGLDGSTITWQTSLADGSSYQIPNSVAIDSAGNAVVAGYKYNTGTTDVNGYVTKFNTSGVVQWQRQISGATIFTTVDLDSSNAVYCAGYSNLFTAASNDMYLAKFDSSGTIQYRRNVGSTSVTSEAAYGLAVLSANYFGIAGIAQPTNYDALFFLGVPSTGASGGATTQKDAAGTGRQEGVAITRGESDDIAYHAIRSYATASTASLAIQVLYRWTLAGGVTWQVQLGNAPTSTNVYVVDVCMDPTGTYVYTCGTASYAAYSQIYIIKHVAATGSIAWQRGLRCTTAAVGAANIRTDSSGNVYVLGDGPGGALLLKMPGDGGGAGNSVVLGGRTYEYYATAYTASTGALLNSAFSPPNTVYGETILTPTATSSTASLSVDEQPL